MIYHTMQDLSREKLLELMTIHAKDWLATDGLWFQGVEKRYGYDAALEIDVEVIGHFTVIEARRIKTFLELPERSGLEGLSRALQFRLNAPVNVSETYMDGDSLIYRVVTCRVQEARRRKGLAYHVCKPVGLVEYTEFARVIDDRITTTAVSCHPDVTDPECNCMWRFAMSNDE